MTANAYTNILVTINNLIEIAKEKGLSFEQPVRIPLIGSNMQGTLSASKRDVIVSFSIPKDESPNVILWLNPVARAIYRNDPYNKQWYQVIEYHDLFVELSNASGFGYAMPVGLDSGGAGTANSAISTPVQSLSDLMAIDTTALPDKSIVFVENEKTIYAFDAQSVEAANGSSIAAPATGPGRWYSITNTSGVLGAVDGGTF
jgi:hypothetical protein